MASCLRFIGIVLAVWLVYLHAVLYAATARSDHSQVVQLAQILAGDGGWHPTSAQIRQIQVLLKDLGFDPGAPDANIGPRTTAAIQAYQRSVQMEADGRLTKDLYERLTNDDGEAVPALVQSPSDTLVEPVQPGDHLPGDHLVAAKAPQRIDPQALARSAPPANPPPQLGGVPCTARSSGIWQFEDARGSAFTLILQNDGSVQGSSYPEHWRWQSAEKGIAITYDNGMGLTVMRNGRLKDIDLMLGEAADSRGRKWTWIAKRLALLPDANDSECQLTANP